MTSPQRFSDRATDRPTVRQAAVEVDRSRAFGRLRDIGFDVEQARVMAIAGLDVVGWVDRLTLTSAGMP